MSLTYSILKSVLIGLGLILFIRFLMYITVYFNMKANENKLKHEKTNNSNTA